MKLTMLVLLNLSKTLYLDSKVKMTIIQEEEVEEVAEVEAVKLKVVKEEVVEANRTWKLMNLNSQLYEEARVKSTCDQRNKERRDLQI